MALQMFYTFTFQNPPQTVGGNMKSSTEHISSQLQKLVEGSEDQLPFNNFYTYQGIKELYQRLANDEKFMEDPIWAMG